MAGLRRDGPPSSSGRVGHTWQVVVNDGQHRAPREPWRYRLAALMRRLFRRRGCGWCKGGAGCGCGNQEVPL